MFGFNSMSLLLASLVSFSTLAESFDIYEHLGNLAPYFVPENTPPSLKSGIPEGCEVDKAFLVHRHGSRQPIPGEIEVIRALSYYINNNTALFLSPKAPLPSEFSFLETGWTSTFTTNDLSGPGRQQLFDHGVALRLDYPDLYTETLLVGGQDRVVESAQWFAAGYYGRHYNTTAALDIIGENNSTISWITSTDTCDSWEYASGNDLVTTWGEVYLPPIASRINTLLAPNYPGLNFTAANAHGMLWACAYGTAVFGKGNTPWCPIFNKTEILNFEYELDLLMRGAFGYGLPNDQGPVLGSLLVSNVTTFLSSNDSTNLFLSFAHDTTIDLGLTALGLANDTSYPATGPPDPSRAWRTSSQVPFAAQMLWKRLDCSGEKRIALELNGANFDLSPVGCESDEFGTCLLDGFVAMGHVQDAMAITAYDGIWNASCSAA
jgi:acid phosphatase